MRIRRFNERISGDIQDIINIAIDSDISTSIKKNYDGRDLVLLTRCSGDFNKDPGNEYVTYDEFIEISQEIIDRLLSTTDIDIGIYYYDHRLNGIDVLDNSVMTAGRDVKYKLVDNKTRNGERITDMRSIKILIGETRY